MNQLYCSKSNAQLPRVMWVIKLQADAKTQKVLGVARRSSTMRPQRLGNQRSSEERTVYYYGRLFGTHSQFLLSSLVIDSINLKCKAFHTELAIKLSLKKQESSRKTSISALLTMPKPLTVWITINCRQFWKRWEYQTTWPASWETYMQLRKQQLELDMEHQTGSK